MNFTSLAKRLLFILGVSLFLSGTLVDSLAETVTPIERVKSSAWAEGSSLLFLLNEDDSLSVYSFAENKFIATRKNLPGIRNAHSILADETGTTLAVISGSYNSGVIVAMYQIKNLVSLDFPEPVQTYPLPPTKVSGTGANFSPDGKLLLISYGENNVYGLGVDEKKEVTLVAGAIPSEIEVSPSGEVFVLNRGSEDVSIFKEIKDHISAKTVKVGKNPAGILYNKKTKNIYISHTGSNDVHVIDPEKTRVIKKIPVGTDPTTLAHDENTGDVFVANNTSGSVSIISTDFKTRTVELNSPAYFNSSPLLLSYLNTEKKLFIVNSSTKELLVYDVGTNKIVKRMETDHSPYIAFVSDSLKKIIISHRATNSIFYVDAKTLEINRISSPVSEEDYFFSKPQAVMADESTNKVFVSNLAAHYITVIDGATQKPIGKINVGAPQQSIFINQEIKKLYAVSPADNILSIVDISRDDYPIKHIRLEGQPRSLMINRKTNRTYLSLSAASSMVVVDGSSDSIITTIPLPSKGFPLVIAVDEEQNRIYVSLYASNKVVVVDGVTNTVEKEIEVGKNPLWVRFTPELKRIFVAVEGDKKVQVIDPNKKEIIQTIETPGIPYRIFFDAKTGYLYINHRKDNTVSIFKENKNTGKMEKVASRKIVYWGETDFIYNMVWPVKNTGLAYFTDGKGNQVIVVRDDNDEEGIKRPIWYATIKSSGEVIFAPTAKKTSASVWTLIWGIILLVTAIAFWYFRRNKIPVTPA